MSDGRKLAGLLPLLLVAVAAVYSNHFQNGFHFDDLHAVTGNAYIQDLKEIPKFFLDGRLSSTLPKNQAYRPVTSTTLALDYWLGKGFKPFYFHLSTFISFLILLALLFFLFQRLMDAADPHPSNSLFTLFAVACFGLHPAIAETVNYVIQRAEIYSTLGVVAALVLYALFPRHRKWGWYLLPAVLAMLAKPPALIFPLILFVYVFLFEAGRGRERWATALRATAPAFAVTFAAAILIAKMTPPQFETGASSAALYRLSQPYMALHYFKSFFLPTELSADTDWKVVPGVFSTEAVVGYGFIAAMLVWALRASRDPRTRPITFGITWFVLALFPTAITPLAEVTNDHRMFFPFIGLALALVWGSRLLLFRRTAQLTARPALIRGCSIAAGLILAVSAAGTWQRNRVWRTDESLWLDVTRKSPENGRGLMNFGVTQLGKGEYTTALQYFERALPFTPNYHLLEINLGIANGGLGRDAEAERHFLSAVSLAPKDAEPHYFYGRWLRTKGRSSECIPQLKTALQFNPDSFDSRHLLMQTYADRHDWSDLRELAENTLRLAPGDTAAIKFQALAQAAERDLANAVQQFSAASTPEQLVELSLRLYQAHKYPECIHAARQALELRPNFAEAYNNIAAAYNSMGLWDDGIKAAQEAVRLNPQFQVARNNLVYATAQKQATLQKQQAGTAAGKQ
jgi:tetratricopeptide (TPR) repeat protein